MNAMNEHLGNLRDRVHAQGAATVEEGLEKLLTLEQGAAYRRHVPISECGEDLVEIPAHTFPRVKPHPYQSVGAQYGSGHSPFHVRTSVLARLERAQSHLGAMRSGFRIRIYDAYRPKAVQRFMVQHELARLARERGLDPNKLDSEDTEELLAVVHTIWARPTDDPTCPTPHSTGGAVDVTIVDSEDRPLDMGGEIDQVGSVSLPSFYELQEGDDSARFHSNRLLLKNVMTSAGFRRLPYEWWHFSFGDQLWALIDWIDGRSTEPLACYGCVEP